MSKREEKNQNKRVETIGLIGLVIVGIQLAMTFLLEFAEYPLTCSVVCGPLFNSSLFPPLIKFFQFKRTFYLRPGKDL